MKFFVVSTVAETEEGEDGLSCKGSGCPIIIKDEEGNYYVQGYNAPETVRMYLKSKENEQVICIPKALLDNIRDN